MKKIFFLIVVWVTVSLMTLMNCGAGGSKFVARQYNPKLDNNVQLNLNASDSLKSNGQVFEFNGGLFSLSFSPAKDMETVMNAAGNYKIQSALANAILNDPSLALIFKQAPIPGNKYDRRAIIQMTPYGMYGGYPSIAGGGRVIWRGVEFAQECFDNMTK